MEKELKKISEKWTKDVMISFIIISLIGIGTVLFLASTTESQITHPSIQQSQKNADNSSDGPPFKAAPIEPTPITWVSDMNLSRVEMTLYSPSELNDSDSAFIRLTPGEDEPVYVISCKGTLKQDNHSIWCEK